MKFIVTLRDPVARAYSTWRQARYNANLHSNTTANTASNTGIKTWHETVLKDYASFDEQVMRMADMRIASMAIEMTSFFMHYRTTVHSLIALKLQTLVSISLLFGRCCLDVLSINMVKFTARNVDYCLQAIDMMKQYDRCIEKLKGKSSFNQWVLCHPSYENSILHRSLYDQQVCDASRCSR